MVSVNVGKFSHIPRPESGGLSQDVIVNTLYFHTCLYFPLYCMYRVLDRDLITVRHKNHGIYNNRNLAYNSISA